MTITFFSPEAPSSTKEVDYGDGVVCERVSTLPEVNVGNETARALVELLGQEFTPWGGELAGADLDAAIKTATMVVNGMDVGCAVVESSDSRGKMRVVEAEGGVTTIGRGARVIDMGVSEERIRHRMAALLVLFTQAKRGGFTVCWG